MSYCTIKRSLARKQYELIVSNDPRNSKPIIDEVFKLGERFLEPDNKLETEFKEYGYGSKSYNFIPFVKGSDAGTGNVREDIESHLEMWRDYNQKMYNEQELDGLIDLLKGYTREEIERLNLTEPIYSSPSSDESKVKLGTREDLGISDDDAVQIYLMERIYLLTTFLMVLKCLCLTIIIKQTNLQLDTQVIMESHQVTILAMRSSTYWIWFT